MRRKKSCLELAFTILGLRHGVCDNAATYPHVRHAILENKRADRYAERCLAGWGNMTDCSRINSSWLAFQFPNDLHRADLRCPCDRTRRKQRAKDLIPVQPTPQLPRYSRSHLQQCFITLHRKEI